MVFQIKKPLFVVFRHYFGFKKVYSDRFQKQILPTSSGKHVFSGLRSFFFLQNLSTSTLFQSYGFTEAQYIHHIFVQLKNRGFSRVLFYFEISTVVRPPFWVRASKKYLIHSIRFVFRRSTKLGITILTHSLTYIKLLKKTKQVQVFKSFNVQQMLEHSTKKNL